MGHLADHVKEHRGTQSDTLHYLIGAIAGSLGNKKQTDAFKVAQITGLMEDFNLCFPSEIITKTLKGDYP
jgi:hypothetical protein